MAISAGCGQLNRSPILPAQNHISYRRLKRIFVPSSCRSAAASGKTIGDNRSEVVSACACGNALNLFGRVVHAIAGALLSMLHRKDPYVLGLIQVDN